MRRTFLPLLFTALLACASAGAQDRVEIYGTASLAHLSNVPTGVAAGPAGYQEQYAGITKAGFGGGVAVRLLRLPLVSLGLDASGFTRGNTNGLDDGIFAVKAGLHLPHFRFQPWIEGGGGFLAVHATNVSPPASGQSTTDTRITTHFAVYQIMGGVDYPLASHMDVRILSISGGRSVGASSATSLLTANSGIVIHF